MVRGPGALCGEVGGRLLGGAAFLRYVYYKGEVQTESTCDNGDALMDLMAVSC